MSTPKWASRLSFISSKTTEVEIDGEKYNFYPLSVRTVLELKDFLPRFGKPIALLFNDSKKNDFGQKSRTVENGARDSDDYMVTSEVVMEPSTTEMAEFRANQKEKGITELAKLLTDPQLEDLLHKVIMSSMRDYLNPNEVPPAKTFFEQVEIPVLYQILKGVSQANKKLFDPFLGLFQAAQEKIQASLKMNAEEETTYTEDSEKTPKSEEAEGPEKPESLNLK